MLAYCFQKYKYNAKIIMQNKKDYPLTDSPKYHTRWK